MKKIYLLLIFIVLAVPAFTHEFSFSYKILGEEDNAGEQDRGWTFNFANLSWGNNSFSDYAFSLNLTELSFGTKIDIMQAWLAIPYKDAKIILGKEYFAFGPEQASGAC